jgi:hypothetical protein
VPAADGEELYADRRCHLLAVTGQRRVPEQGVDHADSGGCRRHAVRQSLGAEHRRAGVFLVVIQGGGHGLDGVFEFWQVVVDGGLQAAVGQVITQPGNLAPWDGGLGVEQLSGQRLDGLADFQQPDPDGVEDQPVGESTPLQVRADRGMSGRLGGWYQG